MSDNNTLPSATESHAILRGSEIVNLNEINLVQLWKILWAGRLDVVCITVFIALCSMLFALLQPNIFRPEAVLAPAEVRQSNSPLTSQLGAAASLVGISVGENTLQITNAISILRSREFTRKFIAEHKILPYLMASEWDSGEGRNVIDPDLYDVESNTWLRAATPPEPSDWSAYRVFSSILFVEEQPREGLIRIAIEWTDPVQATQWVKDINSHIKESDLAEARNSIAYLQDQLASTQLVEMQRVFYQLIESQTRVIMLADVRDEYVFQIIDSAVVPEERVSPNRMLIFVLGTMIGGVLSLLYVFVQHLLVQETRITMTDLKAHTFKQKS